MKCNNLAPGNQYPVAPDCKSLETTSISSPDRRLLGPIPRSGSYRKARCSAVRMAKFAPKGNRSSATESGKILLPKSRTPYAPFRSASLCLIHVATVRGNGAFQSDRHANEFRGRLGPELLDDMGAVDLDGAEADAETLRDDLVGLGLRDEIEDLPFAWRQARGTPPQLCHLRRLEVVPVFPIDGALDAVEQCILIYRLLDEIERPGAQSGDCCRYRAMSGNEDHRKVP